MPTRTKTAAVTTPAGGGVEWLRICRRAAGFSRNELLAAAIARGCRHYAPLWPDLRPADLDWLPHEILGCALMRGSIDEETFRAVRCGAMVVSDLGNTPERVAAAAVQLDVGGRVAHVAQLGLADDIHRDFWRRILTGLPQLPPEERDFMPGLSRLVAETRMRGSGKGPARVWLRTDYRR